MYRPIEEIKREFLKYAPAYAQKEAAQAIDKISELQSQGLIRNGLYYVVLVDLVGSTKFAAEHGNEKAIERIRFFVTSSFRALNEANVKNVALFVKEIGDAVLLIFQHFPDILSWRASFAAGLELYGESAIEIRTCIHLGEVFLEGVNPLSLAVSQCFKMEKSVAAGDIVLTESAYHVAWPTITRAYHAFTEYGEVALDGFSSLVKLYRLEANDEADLKRILTEGIE